MTEEPRPKVFISYSWTTPDHQRFVMELATELREKLGIDIILDRWNLKSGHDINYFMEKSIIKEEIKVLIICDKAYCEKADNRKGGVGTETYIITSEIYENVEQEKFVAAVVEKDENGEPYLPDYLKSRMYIDLSDPLNRDEGLKQILHWSFGRDLYPKPELGPVPSFNKQEISLVKTELRSKDYIENIKLGKISSQVYIQEYLDHFLSHFDSIRISKGKKESKEFFNEIGRNIHDWIVLRNEFLKLISHFAKDPTCLDNIQIIHRFFESLIPYLSRPEEINSWSNCDFDNYRFIIHELFLYTIAILLKYERFNEVGYLLNEDYYVKPVEGIRDLKPMKSFTSLSKPIEYLARLDEIERIEHGIYRHANILKERNKNSSVNSSFLIQADCILFIRGALPKEKYRWIPSVLYFCTHLYNPLEIFSRAKSIDYFQKLKLVLGIQTKIELGEVLEKLTNERQSYLGWGSEGIDFKMLTGFELIETK
ncbi:MULTISPECIES: SEFIR domain-containing protein [Leptospira]|uniref:SEFIR domain-containing protein n=1 Tax=Leptospira TaxID=171 RepID=UPI0002B9D021|nr:MULTISPECIES: SEFIR domain-containing protein [Leptospira]